MNSLLSRLTRGTIYSHCHCQPMPCLLLAVSLRFGQGQIGQGQIGRGIAHYRNGQRTHFLRAPISHGAGGRSCILVPKPTRIHKHLLDVKLKPTTTSVSTMPSTYKASAVWELPSSGLFIVTRKNYSSDEGKKPPPHHDTVLVSLQRLEDSLRYHGYSTIRIGLVLAVISGIGVYIFRESIRENVAEEVSQVAWRSLEDQLVADKAEEFAKGLLDALLRDESLHGLAGQFALEVLQRPDTRRAVAGLVMGVLQDPSTKAQLTATVKQVIITALNEEDTQAYLKSLIKILLSDRETRLAAIGLLHYVFGEAEVKTLTAEFFREVLQSQMVVDQATQLGKEITTSVISDPVLQEKTGDSLWTAMVYSVTPRWLGGSRKPTPDPAESDAGRGDLPTGSSGLELDEESVLGG